MAVKTLTLRRDDVCVACGVELVAGTRALWDSVARSVTCCGCAEEPETHVSIEEPGGPARLDAGIPGASAQAVFDRGRAKHEARIEATWGTGRIGRVAKRLSVEPTHTQVWATGADGERQLAETLARELGGSAVLLHDRRVPGKRSNIDHLVIASSGVWVIDTKKYDGRIEVRDVGGWFRTDRRLYVRGSDKSKLVAAMAGQVDVVRAALGGEDVPVQPALAFVDGEWPTWRGKPFMIDDVWISRPTKLAELIAVPGSLGLSDVDRIARQLAEALPPARS